MRNSIFQISLMLMNCLLLSCTRTRTGEGKQSSMLEQVMGNHSAPVLEVNDYMKWVENKDNGLMVEKQMGDLLFSAMYKPYEYIAIRELNTASPTAKEVRSKMSDYEGLQYFTFKITASDEQKELLRVGIATEQDYYSRLQYFSFQMQHDFTLIEGKDTLACALYHFERVYGLAPYATMVLGFPMGKAGGKQDKTIGYADKVFGKGNVYMTIKKEDLESIPQPIFH